MAGELVLLTGATGMVGFRTLVLLLEAGYKVRAAVRNQAGFDRITALKAVAPYASQVESFIVPDITVTGAYDEAVKGVKYVVHVASPLASNVPKGVDYDSYMIQPAVRGTVGMLESANKTTGIQKVVITASIMSIASLGVIGSGSHIDESTLAVDTKGPFANDLFAYGASKALAFKATKEFVANQRPAFDVINIMPVFILGRDETVDKAENIAKGTNAMLVSLIQGSPNNGALQLGTVHVDDVAKLHVLALGSTVQGNQDFLAASHVEKFEVLKGLVEKHYPKQLADGVFKFAADPGPVPSLSNIDSTKAQKTFGLTFKTLEEQITSVLDYFLELSGK